jgi:tetratricopeptide (TPR) repeat protein
MPEPRKLLDQVRDVLRIKHYSYRTEQTYVDLGDARKAIEFFEQDLVIAREIGDRSGEGIVFGNLGIAYYMATELLKEIPSITWRLFSINWETRKRESD